MNAAVKAAAAALYNFLMPFNYASKIIEGKLLPMAALLCPTLFQAKFLGKPAG
jgi:hypothetical protein